MKGIIIVELVHEINSNGKVKTLRNRLCIGKHSGDALIHSLMDQICGINKRTLEGEDLPYLTVLR